MSLFSDIQRDAGGPQIFATNGKSCTFVAKDGTETVLTALVGDARASERNAGNGKVVVTTREVTIWKSSSEFGGVANPGMNATVTIDGETWSVFGKPADSDTFWRLTVERTAQRTKNREGAFSNS